MQTAALVLLVHDQSMQRLAATWPAVVRLEIEDEEKRLAKWAEIAACSIELARDLRVVLFDNRICTEEGTDDTALRFIARTALKSR